MASTEERSRIAGDEDLERHEAKSLATFQAYEGFHHKSRSTRFSRSTAIIVFLAVTNLVLIAQCLGFWNSANWAPISVRTTTVLDDALPKEDMLSTASRGSNVTSAVAKRGGTTALTEPSVSCDLCPAGDDFCMELG
jgi:hypothetical protein